MNAIETWRTLAERGFTVSVCCGPSGSSPLRWSVNVLAPDGRTFDRPFAARDLEHAIEIAAIEVEQRGWIATEKTEQWGRAFRSRE